MKIKPALTIVTVTYNAEALIEETILNIISQNYSYIEFIIIDGGSTDRTVDIIKKYKKHINYWISEKDNGIYDAMNKAIDLANGEWINFMNAGDSFVDTNTVSLAMSKAKSNIDVLYGDHYYCNGKNKELRKSDISQIYSNIVFNHQSMFYAINVIKRYKFNESFSIVADCELHLRAFSGGKKFHYLNMPVANFLAGGVNKQFRLQTIIEFTHALLRHIPKGMDIRDSFIFQLLIRENSQVVDSSLVNKSDVFDSLKRHIERLCSIRFILNPIRKLKSYKQLIQYYQLIK